MSGLLGSADATVSPGESIQDAVDIQLRSGDISLDEGDLFVIPRGVDHCPVAEEEAHFLLIGP